MAKYISPMIMLALLPVSVSLSMAAQAQVNGTAPTPARVSPAAPVQGASSYVLGPDDEVEMTVFGQPDMGVKTRIKSDGTIIVPLLGAVQAAGLSTAQLSDAIGKAYLGKGFLSNPSVNVEVTTYASKTVTVLGAVPNAGLFPLDRSYSIAAMVARAGGIRTDGANAVILTPGDGGPAERISLNDLSGSAARILKPNDTLMIPPAEQVYVYGQVNQPGGFKYQPGLTYRQILAQAGGPTVAGSVKKFEVRRKGQRLKVTIDDAVEPEDILVIKEKLF
jgi:polysaccharide export outer membrane protein